jgi:peroxiredoxin
VRSDIEVGAVFPDYQLSDHTGEQLKLSEIQGTNPSVLHLARGGYDPKEHRFLRHFADAYPEFKAATPVWS